MGFRAWCAISCSSLSPSLFPCGGKAKEGSHPHTQTETRREFCLSLLLCMNAYVCVCVAHSLCVPPLPRCVVSCVSVSLIHCMYRLCVGACVSLFVSLSIYIYMLARGAENVCIVESTGAC